jgi:ankyrin repeat protein
MLERLLNRAIEAVRTIFVVGAFVGSSMGASMANDINLQFIEAVASEDVDQVVALLNTDVSVDARNAKGETPLLVATHRNNLAIAKLLIAAGADVNAKDGIHDSPYLYAGARGHLDILKLTLSNGADLKSTNRYGGTALIPAAERGYVETVKTLIEAGVNIDHVNNLGWTALMEAIVLSDGGKAHVAIVNLLIDAGADITIADKDGVTPLKHAKSRGYSAIVALLENR